MAMTDGFKLSRNVPIGTVITLVAMVAAGLTVWTRTHDQVQDNSAAIEALLAELSKVKQETKVATDGNRSTIHTLQIANTVQNGRIEAIVDQLDRIEKTTSKIAERLEQ